MSNIATFTQRTFLRFRRDVLSGLRVNPFRNDLLWGVQDAVEALVEEGGDLLTGSDGMVPLSSAEQLPEKEDSGDTIRHS